MKKICATGGLEPMRKFLVILAILATNLVSVAQPSNAIELGQAGLISQGYSNVCAVDYYGELRCWGDNRAGQNDVPAGTGAITALESGDFFTCVIKVNTKVDCWGEWYWGQDYSIYIPNSLKDRLNATQLSAESASVCAAYDNRYIYCWGSGGAGSIRETLDYGSATIKQLEANCVLDTSGAVKCYYPTKGWVTAFASGITKIAHSDFMLCALDSPGQVKCFENYGDSRGVGAITIKASGSKDVTAGSSRLCSIATAGTVTCWADPVQSHLGGSPLTQLSNVQQVSIGSWGDCAFIANELTCPSVWSFEYIGPDIVPEAPDSLNVQILENGQADLSFSYLPNQRHGKVTWTITGTSGNQICSFAPEDDTWCRVSGLEPGKDYTFSLVGQNRSGTTTPRLSTPVTYCSPTPSLSISSIPQEVRSGSKVTITGGLERLCSKPAVFWVRSQEVGKAWTPWVSRPLPANLNFTYSQVITYNTKFEIKVIDRDTTLTSGPMSVLASIKTPAPWKITYKTNKTKQGFTQGGVVTVTFSGDKTYSATCAVISQTKYAFNFALTHMGSESRTSFFKVSKGVGKVTSTMRWNGDFSVSAACVNSKYANSTSYRRVIFKANF